MKGQAEEFKEAGLGDLLANTIHFKLTYDFRSLWRCISPHAAFDFNYIVDYTLLYACYQKAIGYEAGFPASIIRFCEISSPFEISYRDLYEKPESREALRLARPFPQEFINFSGSVAEVILMAWLSTYDKFPESVKTEAIEKTHFVKRELELMPNSAELNADVPLIVHLEQQSEL